MRQSRFTVEEIIRIIAESELPTSSIAGTARKYGIKEATLYRWRAKYKGMGKSEAKRLKVWMMSSLSATSLFNCRFSSSRTLRRLASDLPIPLYLARQRYSVASLMPYLRAVPARLEVG